jgi:cell fate regulator YaaT (PSP1 superfamily)
LAFEKSTYEEMAKILPALGSKVKTPQGEGEVVAQNILKKSVDVAIKGDRGNIIEFPIN